MEKWMLYFLLFLAPLAMAAQDAAKGTVIFYRLNYGCCRTSVWIDGKKVAEIGRESHAKAELTPRKHEFHSRTKDFPVVINVEAGHTYYLRDDFIAPTTFTVPQIFTLVPEETGEAQCKKTKPIKRDSIEDPSLIVEEKRK